MKTTWSPMSGLSGLDRSPNGDEELERPSEATWSPTSGLSGLDRGPKGSKGLGQRGKLYLATGQIDGWDPGSMIRCMEIEQSLDCRSWGPEGWKDQG